MTKKRKNLYKPSLKIRFHNFVYFLATPFRRHRNKKLCKRYPFLQSHYANGEYDENETYDSTFLDCMPEAWKKDFGIKMCEEIRNELIRCSTPDRNWLKEYSLCQVKEKWGTLHWYDNGTPIGSNIEDIISKYEDRSGMICIKCGKPAKYVTRGWVSYQCEHCYMEQFKDLDIPDYQKALIIAKDKLYSDNIPYRIKYNEDGTQTRIDSPYLEEMKKLWPDKNPEKLEEE